jgi:hypothetical protein
MHTTEDGERRGEHSERERPTRLIPCSPPGMIPRLCQNERADRSAPENAGT